MPETILVESPEQSAYDLESRVALLEKNFRAHLGPAFAASSLNIPHSQIASLDARVTALEASVTALQLAIITAGRYL